MCRKVQSYLPMNRSQACETFLAAQFLCTQQIPKCICLVLILRGYKTKRLFVLQYFFCFSSGFWKHFFTSCLHMLQAFRTAMQRGSSS
jgi:hypothetical protein